MELRAALMEQCVAANNSRCQWGTRRQRGTAGEVDALSMGGLGGQQTLRVLRSMSRSVFSLQPAGDDPARQSIIQSLTVGCIPVLFHKAQRELWPLHWGSWVNASSVWLPAADIRSNRLNVLDALDAIPQSRVKFMQRTIRSQVHRMVYALHPPANQVDAFAILLDVL